MKYLHKVIHPKTALIGWGKYDVDLRALRQYADLHGSSNSLPSSSSSPSGVPLIKTVLPGLPSYKLEFMFSRFVS